MTRRQLAAEKAQQILTRQRLSVTQNLLWLTQALLDAERAGMERAAKIAESYPSTRTECEGGECGNGIAEAIRREAGNG